MTVTIYSLALMDNSFIELPLALLELNCFYLLAQNVTPPSVRTEEKHSGLLGLSHSYRI
jgi:hypothetical protein